MKKLLLAALFFPLAILAQEDSKTLYASARNYMMQGDLENATLVINRALQADPGNIEILKDKAYLLYLKRDFAAASQLARSITERPDADVKSFQVLGMIYKAVAEHKEAEKMYKKALLKFPQSGVLYSEFGDLLNEKKQYNSALEQWEKGIEADPNHSANYYFAAKAYADRGNLVKSSLYAENFINIESFSARTAEVKQLLSDNYKRLFQQTSFVPKNNSPFYQVVGGLLQKQSSVATQGITAETLTVIRTNFINDWTKQYKAQFPYRLFDHYQQLIKEGTFGAYNQWIFSSEESAAYKNWLKDHSTEMQSFLQTQRSRMYKLPAQQYYP